MIGEESLFTVLIVSTAARYGQGCAAVPIRMRVNHSYLRDSDGNSMPMRDLLNPSELSHDLSKSMTQASGGDFQSTEGH